MGYKSFQDYNALVGHYSSSPAVIGVSLSPQENHFEQSHHPCPNPTCQAQKFVVFGSQIDLQVHMVEEHAAEMSSRDKKDARRVNATFEFQVPSSNSNARRGGGPGGGGGGGGGSSAGGGGLGRERGQRDSQPQITQRPPMSSDNRRSLFGAHLTTERDANDISPVPSRHQTPSPPPPSMDPVTAEYDMCFLPYFSMLTLRLFFPKDDT